MGDDETDGARVTHGDVFTAHADRCVAAYRLAKRRGLFDPVILIDAPDPTDPGVVVVGSREKLEVLGAGGDDKGCKDDLLTTPADRINVLVLFGEEVDGYTMDRPADEG